MADIDTFLEQIKERQEPLKERRAELQARKAKTASGTMTTEQALADIMLQVLPTLVAYGASGKRGLKAGATGALAGSEKLEEIRDRERDAQLENINDELSAISSREGELSRAGLAAEGQIATTGVYDERPLSEAEADTLAEAGFPGLKNVGEANRALQLMKDRRDWERLRQMGGYLSQKELAAALKIEEAIPGSPSIDFMRYKMPTPKEVAGIADQITAFDKSIINVDSLIQSLEAEGTSPVGVERREQLQDLARLLMEMKKTEKMGAHWTGDEIQMLKNSVGLDLDRGGIIIDKLEGMSSEELAKRLRDQKNYLTYGVLRGLADKGMIYVGLQYPELLRKKLSPYVDFTEGGQALRTGYRDLYLRQARWLRESGMKPTGRPEIPFWGRGRISSAPTQSPPSGRLTEQENAQLKAILGD